MTDSHPIARLPPALLADILQHVPQQQRLDSCASTCRSWQAAAITATHSIVYICHDTANRDEMLAWLKRHGQHVSSIELEPCNCGFGGADYPALPFQTLVQRCPRLQSLQLDLWRFELGTGCPAAVQLPYNLRSRSSRTAARTQPSLTSLTSLILTACQVPDLQHLSVLTKLQKLELVRVRNAARQKHTIPGAALSMLQSLTLLKLDPATSDALAGFSSLTGLRSLACIDLQPQRALQLQHLLQLTHLELSGPCYGPSEEGANGFQPAITGNTAQSFSRLTALQQLSLANMQEVGPAALTGLRHLRQLTIVDCIFGGGGSEDSAAFLSAVGQMTQLQHIGIWCEAALCRHPVPPAAVLGLVASSQLTTLECMLPATAWRQLFQAGRQMPQLLSLNVQSIVGNEGLKLGDADLKAIVRLCPGLRCMELLPEDAWSFTDLRLKPLTQLTALTALLLPTAEKATVATVAELSQLQALKIVGGPDMRYNDCYQLAKLTRLTRLVLLELSSGFVNLSFVNQAPEGERPDVWKQLLFELMEVQKMGVWQYHLATRPDSESDSDFDSEFDSASDMEF